MTYILQVLDLVANGPLKAHMRQLRAKRIVGYFKRNKEQYYAQVALPLDRRVKPNGHLKSLRLTNVSLIFALWFTVNLQPSDFLLELQKAFSKHD